MIEGKEREKSMLRFLSYLEMYIYTFSKHRKNVSQLCKINMCHHIGKYKLDV